MASVGAPASAPEPAAQIPMLLHTSAAVPPWAYLWDFLTRVAIVSGVPLCLSLGCVSRCQLGDCSQPVMALSSSVGLCPRDKELHFFKPQPEASTDLGRGRPSFVSWKHVVMACSAPLIAAGTPFVTHQKGPILSLQVDDSPRTY